MKKNSDVVRDHFIESFKDNLRSVLTASAAVLSVDEIRLVSNQVFEEVASFLDSSVAGDSAEGD